MKSPRWMTGARERIGQVMRLVARVRAWAERTIFWRVWERMLENEFIDRGIALAAKAFVSLFPAVIVVAAFAPPAVRAAIAGTIAHRSGLSGSGLATFRAAFATASNIRRATGVLGLVFTVYYINSFTSALQRAYIRAWRRPPSSLVYGYALGATWLVGILAYFTLIGAMRAAFGRGPGLVLFAVLALAAAIGLWWVTPWVMVPGAVPSLGAPLRAPTLSNAIGIGPEGGIEPTPAPAAGPPPETGPPAAEEPALGADPKHGS
jgi:membrane protein